MTSEPSKSSKSGAAQQRLVSLVVPVFNEEEAVLPFLDVALPALAEVRGVLGAQSATEIVFVDDGSQDRTVEILSSADGRGTSLRVVKLSRNFGKDAALAAGIAEAKGDAVVPMDVDLQDPPELLPRMVEAWVKGAKVVNAVRADRASDGWFKRNTAQAFYWLYNKLSTHPITPNVGDFRLIDREVVEILNQMPERIRFMKGLVGWVGFKPVQVEYRRETRVAGETKWKFWSLWNFALDGITGSTTLPLRIWTYLGGVVACLAVLYAIYIIIFGLLYGIDVPGYASLMVVTLIIGAANMVAIGIIGEYVGRISIEVRQRPLFVVDEVLEAEAPESNRLEVVTSRTEP